MNNRRQWMALNGIAAAAIGLGILGCAIGAVIDGAAFFQAWLCTYLFWLGVPIAGVTLVFVHDLSGGEWMATARPVLDAAIVTMPVATLAGIPAFIGLHSLYSWTQPTPGLSSAFYLNQVDFFLRYGGYVILWNALAAFALWGPRYGRAPIAPSLSWLSGLGLIALALSVSFAAIDWILSLEPTFWSSIFPYIAAASWFNTGLALVVLTIALTGWPAEERRDHMADLSKILLATTIFWAYVEFMQFLIIWEENLKSEIPWYLKRMTSAWEPAVYVFTTFGFMIPFLVLLWAPSKRSRAAVAGVCSLILLSRIADIFWLVLPEFKNAGSIWIAGSAIFALGGLVLLLFTWALRYVHRLAPRRAPVWTADHG